MGNTRITYIEGSINQMKNKHLLYKQIQNAKYEELGATASEAQGHPRVIIAVQLLHRPCRRYLALPPSFSAGRCTAHDAASLRCVTR